MSWMDAMKSYRAQGDRAIMHGAAFGRASVLPGRLNALGAAGFACGRRISDGAGGGGGAAPG